MVSAHDIFKSYGRRTLLGGVSVTIESGDRLGLIGINGAGKSTLIKILVGLEEADQGEIQRKRGLTTRVVTQAPSIDLSLTVGQAVSGGLARHAAIRVALEEVEAGLGDASPEALEGLLMKQAELSEALERAGGWNVEHQAESAMHALGVPPRDRVLESLSQGELRRVALAAALLEQPDLLILDEPTNHIDVEAIEWLEKRLVDYPGAVLLVTHDRYFLDRVANRHAELDRGTLRLYEGNYSEYLAAKAERDATEAKVEQKRQRAIESELTWVRKRAPARSTKQRARLERFDALVAARPIVAQDEASFRLPHPPRIGKTILELHGVSKAFGPKRLVEGLDLLLKRGDRIGIVGPNGAGKSTLLKMILGELEADAGTIVRGQNTLITYADQRRPLDDANTVLQEVAGDSEMVHVGDEAISVYSFLDGLLFDGEAQRTKIAALSGGERSRVALAKALRISANLLILDEPTNDLDLPTLRVLEEALLAYPGCALIVSHDRYFLDRVSTGILAFEGDGKITFYEGSYDFYRQRLAEAAKAGGSKPATQLKASAPGSPAPIGKKRKRSFKEEQEFKGMELKITQSEAQAAELEAELSDGERIRALGGAVKEKMAALEAAKREVERLYARWGELENAD